MRQRLILSAALVALTVSGCSTSNQAPVYVIAAPTSAPPMTAHGIGTKAVNECQHTIETIAHAFPETKGWTLTCTTMLPGEDPNNDSGVLGYALLERKQVLVRAGMSKQTTEAIAIHEFAHVMNFENPDIAERLAKKFNVSVAESLNSPAGYGDRPTEVFAAAYTRCAGYGRSNNIHDYRLTCADVQHIVNRDQR